MLYVACISTFYGQILFYCMTVPHFVIPSLVDESFSCFHFLAIVTNATISIHVKVFAQNRFQFFWASTQFLGVKFLGHMELILSLAF